MSWCWLIRHRWRVQAVDQATVFRNHTDRRADLAARRYTRVLKRCIRCPAVKVEELEGHWTLEQVVLGEEKSDPVPIREDVR